MGQFLNNKKMKTYKKVKLLAKNATQGSYVAGCPAEKRGNGNPGLVLLCGKGADNCIQCERTH